MFGKRKARPETDATATPYVAPTRYAPRSPSESLKPVAVPPPPPRVRRPRGGLLSMLSGALTLGLFVFGVVVFGILGFEREVDHPGPLAEDKIVLIPKGTGTSEVATLLGREGVIDNPSLFEASAYLNRRRGQLKAGEFLFKAHGSIEDAVDTLVQGRAIQHSVTIPEGLTSEQIVQRLRQNDILVGDVTDVPREGSLLPETYKFERSTTRQQIINQMQAAERQALAQAWARRSQDVGIKTPQELIILASIVEKETGKPDERPHVASVFLNRLARHMKLQSDPTIVYGLVGGKGTLGRGIQRAEIDKPTPYNTYAIEGLPPTPIANPGKAALDAVANPAKTKDLYFVADGTGGHVFAETYEQHLRNVGKWRQLERTRDTPGQTDKVEDPPDPPANRTDASPVDGAKLPASATAYSAPGRAPPGQGSAFDAVEGTPQDPLLNKTWDLSSPKSVPDVGQAQPSPATRPNAKAAARTTRKHSP